MQKTVCGKCISEIPSSPSSHNLSMDESPIKSLESQELNGRKRGSMTISVEGYDTCSVHEYSLRLALTKRFASCGQMMDFDIRRDYERRILKSPLFISFSKEEEVDKALELNGRDLGGWKVVVKVVPRPEYHVDPARLKFFKGIRRLYVSVHDITSPVPLIDVEIGLCEHFSSCGEVTDVELHGHVGPHGIIGQSLALISIHGKGCVEKAQKLSGERTAQGWKTVVDSVLRPGARKRKPTGIEHPTILLERLNKMEKKMKKKTTGE